MASNAEILAQLEKLAKGKLSGEMVSCYSHSRSAVSYYADLADFPAILAAFKRLVKIEAEAKNGVENVRHLHFLVGLASTNVDCEENRVALNAAIDWANALDAALKEPQ